MSILAVPARQVWQVGETVNHDLPSSSLSSVILGFKSVNEVKSFKSISFYLEMLKEKKKHNLVITIVISLVMEDVQCTNCHWQFRYHLWMSLFVYLFFPQVARSHN